MHALTDSSATVDPFFDYRLLRHTEPFYRRAISHVCMRMQRTISRYRQQQATRHGSIQSCMHALVTDQPFFGPFVFHQAIRHAEHDASLQEYERRLGELRAEALAEVESRAHAEITAGPLCAKVGTFCRLTLLHIQRSVLVFEYVHIFRKRPAETSTPSHLISEKNTKR